METQVIYKGTLDFTSVTDFGIALEDVLSGAKAIPPQGLRIDVGFEGPVTGRVNGRVSGTDFLQIRADGAFTLDIHAVIETEDGARIAVRIEGVALPQADAPKADLRESVRFSTAHADYGWLNTAYGKGVGVVHLDTGRIDIEVRA